MKNKDSDKKLEHLYSSISQTTNFITFFHAKVGAVLVGIGLCITIIQGSSNSINKLMQTSLHNPFLFNLLVFILILYILFTVTSVIFAYLTIKPINAPDLFKVTTDKPQFWYINSFPKKDINLFFEQSFSEFSELTEEDILKTLFYDNLKLNYIRNIKHKNSLRCVHFFMLSLIPLSIFFISIIIF